MVDIEKILKRYEREVVFLEMDKRSGYVSLRVTAGDILEYIEYVKNKTTEQTAEKIAKKIEQAICDNTYPYFDKDGKPVNIWKAVVGYDKIDEICKEFTEGGGK